MTRILKYEVYSFKVGKMNLSQNGSQKIAAALIVIICQIAVKAKAEGEAVPKQTVAMFAGLAEVLKAQASIKIKTVNWKSENGTELLPVYFVTEQPLSFYRKQSPGQPIEFANLTNINGCLNSTTEHNMLASGLNPSQRGGNRRVYVSQFIPAEKGVGGEVTTVPATVIASGTDSNSERDISYIVPDVPFVPKIESKQHRDKIFRRIFNLKDSPQVKDSWIQVVGVSYQDGLTINESGNVNFTQIQYEMAGVLPEDISTEVIQTVETPQKSEVLKPLHAQVNGLSGSSAYIFSNGQVQRRYMALAVNKVTNLNTVPEITLDPDYNKRSRSDFEFAKSLLKFESKGKNTCPTSSLVADRIMRNTNTQIDFAEAPVAGPANSVKVVR